MTVLAPPPPAPAPEAPEAPERRRLNGADWLASLGGVPLDRVILDPPPGTVTYDDYVALDGRVDGRLAELVNGTLVEKPMGADEAAIALEVGYHLKHHVKRRKIKGGRMMGADGPLRMAVRKVRMPDVSWTAPEDRVEAERGKKVPQDPPTLAVEVVSESNTAAEIDLKLREYFKSGCRLAWVLYPKTRTLRVHASPDDYRELTEDDTLDGGEVLPGFSVRVGDLFDV